MKQRETFGHEAIQSYLEYLWEEERSELTIQKYHRDILRFSRFAGDNPGKSMLLAWKAHLVQANYAPQTINSMLAAVNSLVATVITMRTKVDWEGGSEMDKEKRNSLILVMLNQGYTDAVMETAKKAGARGGTIVRGRWAADDGMDQQFQGMGQQAEKEILYIVVPREIRNGVMEAINEKHGVQTEAGALVCALGIDQMVHLG